MAREIELKIRLNDPLEFQNCLRTLAVAEGPYSKHDTYYLGSSGSFRLRESNGHYTICRKEKTLNDGIEVSREIEFGIDDPKAFGDFAQSLGFRLWYVKNKKGQAWRWGPVLIEVGTVSQLGWFAEFELLLPDESDEIRVDQARQKLFAALESLNVGPDQIEHQTYAQLLQRRLPPPVSVQFEFP